MLRVLLTLTEAGMLLYWLFASLAALSVISIPPELMYSDYENPLVVSWNWSFLPIDIAFAGLGLMQRFFMVPGRSRDLTAACGLTLMFCAGVMAISYWVLQGFYDPFWWGLNLWLMALSIFAFRSLLRSPS